MASSTDNNIDIADNNREHRRNRVVLGPLSPDFLSISPQNVNSDPRMAQLEADRQAAMALQREADLNMQHHIGSPAKKVPRLSVTVAQAKLVKNYGMTRMDPYVRVRVEHCVYETHTDPNGSKNPRWNKTINCLLPKGVNTIFLEIFDECSFTTDELIAWAHISIPPQVFQGESHEDWYPLTGKQGDGMEGMINLVFSLAMVPQPMVPYVGSYPPVMMVPNTMVGFSPMATIYPPPMVAQGQPIPRQPAAPRPQPVPLTEEEIKQIQEMFPSVEKAVIVSVSEANNCDKDATVNSLLQMSE